MRPWLRDPARVVVVAFSPVTMLLLGEEMSTRGETVREALSPVETREQASDANVLRAATWAAVLIACGAAAFALLVVSEVLRSGLVEAASGVVLFLMGPALVQLAIYALKWEVSRRDGAEAVDGLPTSWFVVPAPYDFWVGFPLGCALSASFAG